MWHFLVRVNPLGCCLDAQVLSIGWNVQKAQMSDGVGTELQARSIDNRQHQMLGQAAGAESPHFSLVFLIKGQQNKHRTKRRGKEIGSRMSSHPKLARTGG